MPKNRFPLWLHPNGLWCKKHRGRFFYFGPDKDKALKRYVAEWDDIRAGRPRGASRAREATATLVVGDLANQFLALKRHQVEAGELTPAVWATYYRAVARVVQVLGRERAVTTLGPADFGRVRDAAARVLKPTTLATFIAMIRVMFRYGAELTGVPVRYGDQFRTPTLRVLRLHRMARSPRLVSAADLQKLIAAAEPALKAQILLGINCGFGATDCSDLTRANLDRPGWVEMPRKKTGSARRCPLWPETVAALKVAHRVRPDPCDPAFEDRVFLSPYGRPCVRQNPPAARARGPGGNGDSIRRAWKGLCARTRIDAPGGFYVLRHVFRTVADEINDRPAIDLVMGHTDMSMASHYRERVDDRRLRAVTDHIRAWLRKK